MGCTVQGVGHSPAASPPLVAGSGIGSSYQMLVVGSGGDIRSQLIQVMNDTLITPPYGGSRAFSAPTACSPADLGKKETERVCMYV